LEESSLGFALIVRSGLDCRIFAFSLGFEYYSFIDIMD